MVQIYLHTHPILYLKLLTRAAKRFSKKWIYKVLDLTLPIFFTIYMVILAVLLPGVHQTYLLIFKQVFFFTLWWITLGILSSIGLGSGLHTFVLFLGPYIAELASASSICGRVPKILPNRWEFAEFEECEPSGEVKIFDVIWAVQLESILWGIGTLIGELPPYLIARGSRFEDEEDNTHESQLKSFLRKSIQKYAFLTLCLCASIPNPLFDLAGLMAGHFGVPFWEFFLATGIGKSFIKVEIQVFLVSVMFSGTFLEKTAATLETVFPFLKDRLVTFISAQKNSSFKKQNSSKSIFSYIWDAVILIMVLFFSISLLNSIVKKEKLENGEKVPISLIKLE